METAQCKYTLSDHAHAVSVLALENGIIITGSQDKNINFWDKGVKVTSYQAHDDIIRQIILMKGIGFATCSNDETIKIWDMTGKLLQELKGHNGYVYTLAVNLNTGEIATGSEDCTVKVWKGDAFIDSIQHPGSVWSVVITEGGDIITGCEDKEVRIFTRDPALAASEEEREGYKNLCLAKSAGTLNVDKLPDSSLTKTVRGKKDGEIKVFKTGSSAEVYVWKEAEEKWEKMGDVMGPSPTQKDYYEGDDIFPAGYYDYIFNIDIKDRGEKKLPFNRGSIPLEEAEKFVERERIHRVYVEEISSFIRNNLEQVPTYMAQPPPDYQQEVPSFQKEDVKQKVHTTVKHLPMIFVTKFDSVNVDNPSKKIKEFNAVLIEDPKYKSVAMVPFEENIFNGLMDILKNESNYHLSKIDETKYELMGTKLLQWPSDKIFPVIDVIRMMLMHPSSQAYFGTFEKGMAFFTNVIRCVKPDSSDPLLLLSLRSMCNMFDGASTIFVMDRIMNVILSQFGFLATKTNKNVLIGAAGFLLK